MTSTARMSSSRSPWAPMADEHTLAAVFPLPSGNWQAGCSCGRGFRGPDEHAATETWRYHRHHPDEPDSVIDELNPDVVGPAPEGTERHAALTALRREFPPELVGQLPRGNVKL